MTSCAQLRLRRKQAPYSGCAGGFCIREHLVKVTDRWPEVRSRGRPKSRPETRALGARFKARCRTTPAPDFGPPMRDPRIALL